MMKENKKTILYKGRAVFRKLSLPTFKRQARDHYENEACFAFFTKGEYRVRDQNKLFNVNPQMGLLAKCTNYFYESSNYPNDSEEGGEAIAIFLYPDILQCLFNVETIRSPHMYDYNLRQVEVGRLLGHYRDSINILLETPELADDLLIGNKLKEFVLLMTRKLDAPSEVDFLASMFKPYYARFEDVIKNNLYTDLGLEELAKLCHMSLSSFKRKFRDVYSESPGKYMTRLKIEKAKTLLKLQDLPVSEIVFQAGFNSISAFNRAFKAETGQSPTEFRLS